MDPARAPNRRDVLRNSLWLIFEQGFGRAIGLVVGLWVARYLQPAAFGALSFALTFVSLFFWMAQLGIEAIAVRELVRRPEDEGRILGSAMRLQLAGAALGVAVIFGTTLSVWGWDTQRTYLIGICTIMLAMPVSGAFVYRLKARVAEHPAVLARNVSVLIGAGMRVMAILAGAGVYWFAGANALSAVLVCVLTAYVYRASGGRVSTWTYDHTLARSMFRDAWPLALSAVAIVLNMQVDQVMLGLLSSDYDVGIYGAAVRVSEATYVIPVAVAASAYPLLVRLRDQSQALFDARLQNLMDWLTWIAIPGAAIAGSLAPWLVDVAFGSGYAATAPVLSLHVWSATLMAQMIIQGQWFLVMGRQRIQSAIHLMAALLNVGLNLWLIPLHGPTGAAEATLLTYGFIVLIPLASRSIRPAAISALTAYVWPLRRLLGRNRPPAE